MPQRHAAVKSLKKDKKRHAHNLKIRKQFKRAIKEFKTLVQNKKLEEAKKLFPKLSSQLSKAAKKCIIQKNTAARKISRLQLSLNKAHLNN